jgi:hypothetical protein
MQPKNQPVWPQGSPISELQGLVAFDTHALEDDLGDFRQDGHRQMLAHAPLRANAKRQKSPQAFFIGKAFRDELVGPV